LTWLATIEVAKEQDLKWQGICDMITLLKVDMTINIESLYGFLAYMPVSSNNFIFSKDMIIWTILDVASILGFPIIGLQALTTYDVAIPPMGFHFSKSISS